MSRGSVAALLLVCSVAGADRFQDLPLFRDGYTAGEQATTEENVDFSLHFNLFRNILSTTRNAAIEVAAVGDGETSTRTVQEEHVVRVGQDEDIDSSTSLVWATAVDILHVDSEQPTKSNVDVKLKRAAEACGSEQQVGSEDLTDSGWQESTSPYNTLIVASRGTKTPYMSASEPDEMPKRNGFFHTFWDTKSGPLKKVTYQNVSIRSETNYENYSNVNVTRNYDGIKSGDENNSSAATGIRSSTKLLGMRLDDRNSNAAKTKGLYNLRVKASSPMHEGSNFQYADNTIGGIVALKSETASDDAQTNSYGRKHEYTESSSIWPIQLTDTYLNSVGNRPIVNYTLGLRHDKGMSTVGTGFIDRMNVSSAKSIPNTSSKYNKEVLSNIPRNYTTLNDRISNILADSPNENDLSSARLLSAGTSNSSFTDRIIIDVGDESNTPDKILFTNSTQYRLWHFILEAFKALKARTLELIQKVSRPIQKLGHGLENQFSNMAPLMSYSTISQKSQVTLLFNGSKLNCAVDKSPTTQTSFPDDIAPSGENEVNNVDFFGQTFGNLSSDVTRETANDELPTRHPESVPNMASWYPKSWRSKRQISLVASERNGSTKQDEINVDCGPTTKINALSSNARCQTTKNCAWNYENALDYPEYFNTKVQTTTAKGMSLSPSKLWLEIKSWTASKAKLLNVSYITALLHKKKNEDKDRFDGKYVTVDEAEAEIMDGMYNYNQVLQDNTGDTTETNYYDNGLRDGVDNGLEDYYSDDEIYGEKNCATTANEHENVLSSR